MNFRFFKAKQRCCLMLMLAVMVFTNGCGISEGKTEAKSIIILYTNDVHCDVDGDIGYAGLAAYKEWCGEKTPYITLVDCGDALPFPACGL